MARFPIFVFLLAITGGCSNSDQSAGLSGDVEQVITQTAEQREGDPVDGDSKLPEIVEVFACSDNCPGPEEKYRKRIYDGISDEEECRKLGGKPHTYFGWRQYTVCEVK